MYFANKRQNELGILLSEGKTKYVIIPAQKNRQISNFWAYGTIALLVPLLLGRDVLSSNQ